jgi:type III pantothenate kinase
MYRPLLAIDAGNSRLKFGLFVPSRSAFYRRTGTTVSRVVDVSWQAEGAVIAGSNPQAVERVLSSWHDTGMAEPLVVRERAEIPVSVDVDFPEKVGLDRLLNAVAANALRPASRPVIVVDSGTATTVNWISSAGTFCGGAILPGLEMSAKALNHYTAVLPLLPVQDLGGELPISPGRNTREALRNGLFWGQVGAIRELVRQLCRQPGIREPDFNGDQDSADSPWMILTGGGGPVLSSQFPGLLLLPSLGMHGLVLTAWKKGV